MNRSSHIWRRGGALVALLVGLCGALGATPSWAADRREEPRWWQHGDIRRFHEGDLEGWRGGHWIHDRHDGRLGWWWVVGGMWYFYPAPVYPYPDPYVPPMVAPSAPPASAPAQYWYYCAPVRGYYPYVTSCPEAWMQVVPPPTAPRPGG